MEFPCLARMKLICLKGKSPEIFHFTQVRETGFILTPGTVSLLPTLTVKIHPTKSALLKLFFQ